MAKFIECSVAEISLLEAGKHQNKIINLDNVFEVARSEYSNGYGRKFPMILFTSPNDHKSKWIFKTDEEAAENYSRILDRNEDIAKLLNPKL